MQSDVVAVVEMCDCVSACLSIHPSQTGIVPKYVAWNILGQDWFKIWLKMSNNMLKIW